MRQINLRGINFYTHDNEALSNHIHREKDFFEANILDYLRDNFKTQKTIIDIGANIGNHTVYFANFLKYRMIVSFEPIPANFEILVENVTPYPNICLVPYALGDTFGTLPMCEYPPNMGASHFDVNGDLEIPVYRLDSFIYKNITLLKIDVESFEPQVLHGAEETINRCKPLILIEDWDKEYASLLPDYDCIQGWEREHTFLYKWRGK